MEHFYTVQGEGSYSGVPAYFIRLGGCDVGCVWCDVKDSWDAEAHPKFSVEDIASWPLKANAELVVITGGEPLMYDLYPLTRALREAGLKVNIETSGAHPLTGSYDWICLSPKKFKAPRPEICSVAQELKIIIFNKSDFEWAEKYASRVSSHCRLFLQPEWEKSEQMLPLIIDYVKAHPRWRISLQTHKFMQIP
ncbi:MAG: radical SAM protein [Bacteroidetes bacterium]|nr:radical SAM protein [Bacteroidota bacterium]